MLRKPWINDSRGEGWEATAHTVWCSYIEPPLLSLSAPDSAMKAKHQHTNKKLPADQACYCLHPLRPRVTHMNHDTVKTVCTVVSLATLSRDAPRTTTSLRATIRTGSGDRFPFHLRQKSNFHPRRLVRSNQRRTKCFSFHPRRRRAFPAPRLRASCLEIFATHRPVQPSLHLELALADRVTRAEVEAFPSVGVWRRFPRM